VTALRFDHAKEMQRADVTGLGGQYLAIQHGRLVEMPAPMQRGGSLVARLETASPIYR
jgi:hypothetical protein